MAKLTIKPLSLRIGYKIVSGNKYSYIQPFGKGQMKYPVKKWAERAINIDGKRFGGLAVFDSLENARRFTRHRAFGGRGQIWLCLYQQSRVKSMWYYTAYGRRVSVHVCRAPQGTVLADFVLLVEKVEEQ